MLDFTNLISSVPLFNGLNPEEIKALEAESSEQSIEAGQIIITESTLGSDFFLLASGECEACMKPAGSQSNEQIILAKLSEGDVFGELALIKDSGHRMATIRSTKAGKVLRWERESLEEVFFQYPMLGQRIYKNMCQILASRLMESNLKLRNIKTI